MSDRIRTIRRKKDDKPEAEADASQMDSAADQTEDPTAAPPAVPMPKAHRPEGPRIDAAALEAEAKALDADAMASLMEGAGPTDPEPGHQVEGVVASITKTTVYLNIGAKSEGTIERDSLSEDEDLTVGDTLSAFVVSVGAHGIKLAAKRSGAGTREMLEEAFRGRFPIEGVVEGRNPGGFNVMLSGIKAFCPASQIARFPSDDLDSFVGQTLVFLITEFKERDVVVSHRAYEEGQAADEAAKTLDTLTEGDIKEGTVVSVQDFGVFVELGGVQGLLHKSELGQGAEVELPAKGDVLTVRVKSIDRAKDRISLVLKDQAAGPWATVGTDFIEGEAYTGTITRIMDFGAFVKLAEGLEGLVHISQMAEHRVDHPRSVVKAGQEVKVHILEIDMDRKRIGLSMKGDGGDGRAAWGKHQRIQGDKKQSLGTFADLLGDFKIG
jgi:small subunit ribosomal protein S1